MTRRPAQPEMHGLFPAASHESERRWTRIGTALLIASDKILQASRKGGAK